MGNNEKKEKLSEQSRVVRSYRNCYGKVHGEEH